jgi:hypothetical protein
MTVIAAKLAELRALDAARTPGPWEVVPSAEYFAGRRTRRVGWGLTSASGWIARGSLEEADENAAAIAAALNALPGLLVVAEAASAAVEAAGTNDWPVNCDRLRMALEALGDAS